MSIERDGQAEQRIVVDLWAHPLADAVQRLALERLVLDQGLRDAVQRVEVLPQDRLDPLVALLD